MTENNSFSSGEDEQANLIPARHQQDFNEYMQKNKGRKRKKLDEYDLEGQLVFEPQNIPRVKLQQNQQEGSEFRLSNKKKEGRVKKQYSEHNESETGRWEQEQPRRKLKFQYPSNSLYPTKIRRKKLPDVTPEDDPQQYTRRLMQMARQYHKHLRQEIEQNMRLKKEEGIKEEPYEWVSIDKSMNTYPLDNERMRFKKFSSVSDFLNELKKQEEEILTEINDPHLKSVFYQNLQASIKKTNGSKEFHNFKCKIPNCSAILKCSVEPEGCDLYLIRNKHNHTVTGQMLQPKEENKQPETIVIDEQLHKMFGLYKGVRSETQNVKYKDPQQMKIHQAQQRADYNQKCRIMKRNTKLGIPLDEEPYKMARKPNKKKKTEKSRMKSLRRKRSRLPLSKYEDEPEFINIPEELMERNYRLEYTINSPESRYPEFIVLASKQMMSLLVQDVSQVRMSVLEQAMKLDRKKCPSHPLWSIVLFTTLNTALKPVILAVGMSSILSEDYVSKLLSLFLKLCPNNPKYLITENKPQIYTQIKKGIEKQNMLLHYLLDSESTLSSLQTLWNNAKKVKILRGMMDPINYYRHEEMVHHMRKQTMILQKFEEFRKHSFIPEGSPCFMGFKISLLPESDIVAQVKARLRFSYYRHSMKRQFADMMTLINNYNQTNQSYITTEFNIEVERIFNDAQLEAVRNAIGSRVLNQFCLQYRDAEKLSFQKQEDGTYSFEEGNLVIKNGVCGCQYREVTGVPCRHMIKVLKSNKQDYVKWINPRWLISRETESNEKKSEVSTSRRKRIPHEQSEKSEYGSKRRKSKREEKFQSEFGDDAQQSHQKEEVFEEQQQNRKANQGS